MCLPDARGLYQPSFEHDACGVGFVADVTGRASHQTLLDAASILENLDHRAGRAADGRSGDGAGILVALPHAFYRQVLEREMGLRLPASAPLAVGHVFLPRDPGEREHAQRVFEREARRSGVEVLGWRAAPVDPRGARIGSRALHAMPVIEQLFVTADLGSDDAFERALSALRRRAEGALRADARLREGGSVHVSSLSGRVIVFKGMFTPAQLLPFYADLRSWDFRTHLAMVHSRFSTNTFPSWDRAQPMRWMSHNGEINTLRGNVNAMRSREGVLAEAGGVLDLPTPIVPPDTSDSGSFDSVLELLMMSGRSLPEAIMTMIPEAWENDEGMSAERKAFYRFAAAKMQPWDGPASITFTDGRCVGAVLDRNGLRPSRFTVTRDDRVIMSSEAGALPIEPELVERHGRLEPGRMLLIDFEQQRLVPDHEIKARVAAAHPYGDWLERRAIALPVAAPAVPAPVSSTDRAMAAFGYTAETLRTLLTPMLREGRDPIGSMGDDAALACLSELPRSTFDYFRQLFAQVTNPPIDPIREDVVMSLGDWIGPEGSVLEWSEDDVARLYLDHPLISEAQLAGLKAIDRPGWSARTLDLTRAAAPEPGGLEAALEALADEAEAAVDAGCGVLVLDDRAVSADRVPMPVALAVGAVHQRLLEVRKRTRVAVVVDSGEVREVHHFCVLLGYGADAIHPWLALRALGRVAGELEQEIGAMTPEALLDTYREVIGKGIRKVMSRMGISVLASYKGAQIFEAIGLAEPVVRRCFRGTPSRLGGVGFDLLDREAFERHARGFRRAGGERTLPTLPNEGLFQWRAGGERHVWSPDAITALQRAAREGDPEAYQRFSDHVQAVEESGRTLRGLLRTRPTTPVPLDEVEPAVEIVKRFATGAMSFGSLSAEAHGTLAEAMNSIGAKSNSGEGGEDPARIRPLADGSPNPLLSRIKQVASGRFGVTIDYLVSADEIQIKMAQGAKPGEGGHLPGRKVDEAIARVRHSTPGVSLISPPPHHDIYSIEDLAQLIFDLKRANPRARISVKLVSEMGVGTVAAGVVKAGANHVLISGHDGGTGASPLTSVKHAGSPWELGLVETHQTLVLNGLRDRTVVQVDGQLKTGRDVVVAALLGADEFGFATAPLITLGCVMMRKCHLNTCPVGIATQDPELRARFAGQPEHVTRYLFEVAEEARRIMAELGFRSVAEMVGRSDVLEQDRTRGSAKARSLDLAPLLARMEPWDAGLGPVAGDEPAGGVSPDERCDAALDRRLIELALPVIDQGGLVSRRLPICSTDRAVGALLSHEIVRRRGERRLPEGSLHFHLVGAAGQSLGAWLTEGVTLEVEGQANDYVGKGLSGGRIVVRPPERGSIVPEQNVIAGNVMLYGATSGEMFVRGRVAERFAVRNSGARAVVEGVGDHGCEYMTGGRVAVLGPTGRNFGAGMSGGIAWVWDPKGEFRRRVNLGLVELERAGEAPDVEELRELLLLHHFWTKSTVAAVILDSWERSLRHFVRVIPSDYRRVLEERRAASAPSQGVA
ncbi:glutamate synthase large subunit [Gemmatimonadota bacterium Y43]|uniref:glutamate synthase large subunit n=1 Tax=Gaopeijia maritima TaxID=3119007 RepID=UPI00329596C2